MDVTKIDQFLDGKINHLGRKKNRVVVKAELNDEPVNLELVSNLEGRIEALKDLKSELGS